MRLENPAARFKQIFSKQHIKELFTRRTFKVGGYTALACVVALAIAVVAVLAMETLPTTWTKLDISEEGTTTLSDESKEKLSQLEDELTIYCICKEGEEDDYVSLLLGRNTEDFSEMTLEFVQYDSNFYLASFNGEQRLLVNRNDVADLSELISTW